jgi:hypothetical protein
MIAVQKEPADRSWIALCRELDVLLAWPETVRQELRRLT